MNKPNRLKLKRLYRGRKTSFWDKLTGRKHHRLSASVTGEGDWEVEVPQIRMSRAFAVMLALHIIAVGGLFAYRIWGREEEPATGAESAQANTPDATTETPSAIPAPPPVFTPPAPPAPADVKTYIWRAGDSIQLIAASYGISTSALREANPDRPLVPGAEIIVPRAGRVFGGAEIAAPTGQPSPVFDPQATLATTPAASAAPAAPRALEVPELPAHSEIPDVIPAPADEAGVIAQPVSSRPPAAATKQPVNDKTTVSVKPPPPAGTIATTTAKQPVKQPARTAGQSVHVVAKGDTVYNLARKYGYSAEEIAKANGLGGDYRITLGQPLKIPVKR